VTSSAAFSQPQPGHQVANPFMAPQAAPGYPQGAPQPPPYGQYGQSMPVGYPVSAAGMPPNCPNTGFPAPQYAASPVGQFQNGGVAAPAPSAGAWGAFGGGFAPAGMMPAAQGQYQKPGMPGPQPGVGAPMPGQQQFGATPAVSGWGGQPGAGNPFMVSHFRRLVNSGMSLVMNRCLCTSVYLMCITSFNVLFAYHVCMIYAILKIKYLSI